MKIPNMYTIAIVLDFISSINNIIYKQQIIHSLNTCKINLYTYSKYFIIIFPQHLTNVTTINPNKLSLPIVIIIIIEFNKFYT
jgi:hypothetical protein